MQPGWTQSAVELRNGDLNWSTDAAAEAENTTESVVFCPGREALGISGE